MTPAQKFLHVLGLVVAMILIVGPSFVTGFNLIGLPSWAHAVSGVVGLLSIPIIRQMLPIPTTSSMAKMKAAVLKITAAAFVLLLVACAAVPAITKTVADEFACVEGEISKGDDTFEGIALACAPLTVSDVGQIVISLAASKTSPVAPLAAKIHHVTPGTQPKPAL